MARKISGKIEFSHHGFVMAFFVRRKQIKAPPKRGKMMVIYTCLKPLGNRDSREALHVYRSWHWNDNQD